MTPLSSFQSIALKTELEALEAEVRDRFAVNGIKSAQTVVSFHAAMRYQGQEHTVKVPILRGDLRQDLVPLRRRFDEAHERAYSLKLPESATEIVNLQVSILGITSKPILKHIDTAANCDPLKGARPVTIRGHGADMRAKVYDRERLAAGAFVDGPAIIEEWTSTTLILPNQSATVDEYGNLNMKRARK